MGMLIRTIVLYLNYLLQRDMRIEGFQYSF